MSAARHFLDLIDVPAADLRQMIEAAEELIVVSDSSKLGHPALVHLCPLEQVDQLIVDAGISDAWRQIVRRAGVELTVVGA